MVSHDRGILETSCTRIVELNRCYRSGYLAVEGSYTAFIEQREELLRQQNIEEQRLANVVRREVAWLHRGAAARTSKSRSRIDKAGQLQEELRGVRGRNRSQTKAEIEFDATGRRTRVLIQGEGLALERGGRRLFSGLDLRLGAGQCLGILGSNGSGKSSLLQMLSGGLEPCAGKLRRADGLKVVLFDQQREQLDLQQTLRQALSEDGDQVIYQGRPVHVAAWAKRFLFLPEQLNQPLHTLSGGEQARVLIANLVRRPADLLMLDEPTNDLDLATLEILEESLAEFKGTLVLISHDRCFLDTLCDRLLALEDGQAVYYADLNQWAIARERRLSRPGLLTAAPVTKPVAKPDPGRGLSYDERKELSKLETRLAKAEAAAKAVENRLNDPANASDAGALLRLDAELQAAQAAVDAIYRRWAELEER